MTCIYCGDERVVSGFTAPCCEEAFTMRHLPADWIVVPYYYSGEILWNIDSWDDNRTAKLGGYKTKAEAIAAAKEAVK